MAASRWLILVAVVAEAVAGCTAVASTQPPEFTPTNSPGVTPTPAPAQRGSPEGVAPVTTPDEAVARVVAVEPRFAGIGPFDPQLIGQSSWYTVEPALGVTAYVVTFEIGSGDCLAGCIDVHTWVYHVARDGTVTLASEAGDPISNGASPQ